MTYIYIYILLEKSHKYIFRKLSSKIYSKVDYFPHEPQPGLTL